MSEANPKDTSFDELRIVHTILQIEMCKFNKNK